MPTKESKPQKERSEARKQMDDFLKRIGAKDNTAERMGKSSLTIKKKY